MSELYMVPDKPLSSMTQEELLSLKACLEAQIASLDEQEPADEASESYEDWADIHEDLEDRLDEVLDLLEG